MKYFIYTFGCQMNEYDSERMGAILADAGYEKSDDGESADLVLINTCSVREKPQHKVGSLLGRLKDRKSVNDSFKVGVTGCVAQQEGENLLKSFSQLDFVIGTDAVERLGDIVEVVNMGERVCDTRVNDGGLNIPRFVREGGISAYLTIMKGCDNFCSYCIVPYVRGREKSRPVGEIIDEAKMLTASGVKEITLLGQNVNSYGKTLEESVSFTQLLNMVQDVQGLERLRFVTSHPKDFSAELADAMAEMPSVCEYLHLPLQAGSDDVLKRMNRGYTYGKYRDKVFSAKEKIDGLALSSDFIVGFPGETEADFIRTIDAVKEIGYESIFAFKYSVRPGTKACDLEDNVPDAEKTRRLEELLRVQKEVSSAVAERYVGTVAEVMIEGISKRDEKELSGRNRQNRIVNFVPSEQHRPGDIVNVQIQQAKPNSLFGKEVSRK